jgi:twitching motility protein PilT
MPAIDGLLRAAVSLDASDLHVPTGSPPLVRRFGELRQLAHPAFAAADVEALVLEMLTPEQRAKLDAEWELDFAYEIPGLARFRSNAFRQRKGIDACFRVIRSQLGSFAQLGIPAILEKVCENHQGLILVTGAAGSGKSTTLAAMVDLVNSHRAHHVLTVEDPIEYVHPVKKGAVNQRELGTHTRSYANALKAALREDPDVIMVGELRDIETISLAISASETGHLVIGSMNTSSAHKTIDKIIDSYPSNQQNQIRAMLGESLKAVFTQRLLPRADGKGMVLAYELLLGSLQLANLIKDGKTFQIPNIMQTGKGAGMRQMDDSLLELVKGGHLAGEVAWKNASNPKLFQQWAPADAAAAPAERKPPLDIGGLVLRPVAIAPPAPRPTAPAPPAPAQVAMPPAAPPAAAARPAAPRPAAPATPAAASSPAPVRPVVPPAPGAASPTAPAVASPAAAVAQPRPAAAQPADRPAAPGAAPAVAARPAPPVPGAPAPRPAAAAAPGAPAPAVAPRPGPAAPAPRPAAVAPPGAPAPRPPAAPGTPPAPAAPRPPAPGAPAAPRPAAPPAARPAAAGVAAPAPRPPAAPPAAPKKEGQ